MYREISELIREYSEEEITEAVFEEVSYSVLQKEASLYFKYVGDWKKISEELSKDGNAIIHVGDNIQAIMLAEELNEIIAEQGIQKVMEKLR